TVSAGEYDLIGGILPAAVASCPFDVDQDGHADPATDVVYIARYFLGLPPVPPGFRVLDPSIPADTVIAARIVAAGGALAVDAAGPVEVATDLVYINRHLLGLPPVPPSFRVLDPNIAADVTVAAHINAACP